MTPGTAEPRARQPPLPLRDHHAPGRSAPRRGRPGRRQPRRPYVHALTVAGVTEPKPGASGVPGAAAPPRSRPGPGICPGFPPRSLTQWWDAALQPSRVRRTRTGALHPTASPPSFGTAQLPAVGFSLPSGGDDADAGAVHDDPHRHGGGRGGRRPRSSGRPSPDPERVDGVAFSGTLGLGSSDAAAPSARRRVRPRHPSRLPSLCGAAPGDGIRSRSESSLSTTGGPRSRPSSSTSGAALNVRINRRSQVAKSRGALQSEVATRP